MRHLLSVVFGAAFTIATAWAIGRLLFSRLRIALTATESLLLATVTGASLLSLLVFLLCNLGAARTEVFLVAGTLLIYSATRVHLITVPTAPQKVSPAITVVFWLSFAFYCVIYLSNSLAPEISPDGVSYHLGLVAKYYRDHGFHKITTNMYASLSQGVEMLFLYAFSIGRHSAAATVHCSFLLAAPFLFREYGRRIGRPVAGIVAGMFFFLSPLAGIDGVSAYNDVALAVVAFTLFYLLEIWRDNDDPALLIPIGLLAGFCFAIKYTGFVAFLYAAAVVLSHRRWKPLIPVATMSALLALPWLIKNAVYVRNPVSPFLNEFFPNPYIHVSFEKNYTEYFRNYDLKEFWSLPRMVTTGGELGGELGPLFILTPLVLFTLRSKAGRHVAIALLFFLLPYPNNIGARFLLPALPFAAFGIALCIDNFGSLLPVAAIMAASVLAWPRVIDWYRAPAGGWQIRSVPWREALRLKDSDKFMFDRIPHILVAREMDEKVADGARVWSTSDVAAAYCKRDVLVNYESAEGELIEDILVTATHDDLQPTWILKMTFPARMVQRFRIVQTARSTTDVWSIGELHLFHGEKEIAPDPAWHLDARPNPWDAALAFDRNPATRWRTWQSIEPGMYLGVEMPVPIELDRIEAHAAHDQWKVEIQPEVCGSAECVPIRANLLKSDGPKLQDLRKEATRAVLQRNVRYLLIEYNHPLANDIYPDPARWGLRLLADRNRTRLYVIEE